MEKLKKLQDDLTLKLKAIEENLTEFSLDQIKLVQDQLKNLEVKIKENQKEKKVKTITISEEVHTQVKKYCVDNGLKINEWVESKLSELTK